MPLITATPYFDPIGTYYDEVIASAPIGYWRLGESTPAADAADEVGSRPGDYINTPLLNQAGALASDANTAARFRSSQNEYLGIDTPTTPAWKGILGNNPRSVIFWVKTTDTTEHGIISWGHGTTNGGMWHIRINDSGGDGTVGAIQTNVLNGFQTGATNIADGAWHFVCSTYSGTNATDIKHYVDGSLEASSGFLSQAVNTVSRDTVRFASRTLNLGSSDYFDGTLDEVAIYDSEISASTITRLYTAGIT